MVAVSSREARAWELFADWCASIDTAPLPASPELIADFLNAFPAPIETQGRRVKAIRRAHARAGAPLTLAAPRSRPLLREGAEWAPVARALAQAPKYHFPKRFDAAVRGRRDSWLIVLVGIIGLTRNEARNLHHSAVRLFPHIAIADVVVPKADPPAECPACAVTRWLRIAGAASFGFWDEVKTAVRPDGANELVHDCSFGLDGVWRQANTLLPAVDRHGWVSADPMSARTVSATMAYRQALGPVTTISTALIRSSAAGRFADATPNELADAYDDVDQRAAAALLRIKELDTMLEDFAV